MDINISNLKSLSPPNSTMMDIDNLTEFINMVFGEDRIHKMNVDVNYNLATLTLKDEYGSVVTNTITHPNIKIKSMLGYYCRNLDLCLIRTKKGDAFTLCKGVGRNKPIRPLIMKNSN